MKLEGKHWMIIALLIGGVATELGTAQHGWADVLTPGFVAGLLMLVASAITAIFVGAPGASDDLAKANQRADRATVRADVALTEPRKVDVTITPGPGTAAALLLCLLLPAVASAQVGTEPLAWQPEHRTLADGISSALVGVQAGATVYFDAKTWREGNHTPTFRSSCSITVAMAVSEILKRTFPELRPDGSDDKSWPSGHSAATMALSGGWQFEFVGIGMSVLTGFFREFANLHHVWVPVRRKVPDIPMGWLVGAGARALCYAVIR